MDTSQRVLASMGLGRAGRDSTNAVSLAAHHQLAACAFQHGHKVLLIYKVETAGGGALRGEKGDDCTCRLVLPAVA